MTNLLRTAILFGFGCVIAFSSRADDTGPSLAGKCLDVSAIMELTMEEAMNVLPCDFEAKMFLFGVGVAIDDSSNLLMQANDELQHYALLRSYLNTTRITPEIDKVDTVGLLLAAMPELSHLDPEKAKIYEVFTIWRFMDSSPKSIVLSKDVLYSQSREIFQENGLRGLDELACLVLLDSPSMDLSEIKSTRMYEQCVTNGGLKWLK